MKPRVIKIPEENINTLEQSLVETLGLENFQLYFPHFHFGLITIIMIVIEDLHLIVNIY